VEILDRIVLEIKANRLITLKQNVEKSNDRKLKNSECAHTFITKTEDFQGNLLASKPLTLRSSKKVKKEIICFICNKKRHISRNCPNRKREKKQEIKSLQVHKVSFLGYILDLSSCATKNLETHQKIKKEKDEKLVCIDICSRPKLSQTTKLDNNAKKRENFNGI
jgi:hypothetical protein